eukprot:scaffold6276_cov138-Cylindrotheca_fusiformis.AAC.22
MYLRRNPDHHTPFDDRNPVASQLAFLLPSIGHVLSTIKQGGGCCSGELVEEPTESLVARAMPQCKAYYYNYGVCTDSVKPIDSAAADTASQVEGLELKNVTWDMHLGLVYAASIVDGEERSDKETTCDESYSWFNNGSTAGYFYQNE